MKRILLVFSVLVWMLSSSSHSMEQLIRQWQSPRTSGMGGVVLSTGLYDQNFYANPARVTANPEWKLTLFDLTAETTTSTVSTVSDLLGDGDTISKAADTAGKNNHGRIQTSFPSVYIPRFFSDRLHIAFGLLMSTQFDLALRNSYNIDTDAITDVGPVISIGHTFLENDALAIGLNLRYTYRLSTVEGFSFVDLIKGGSISPAQTGGEGSTIDGDLGATYTFTPFSEDMKMTTAFAIQNVAGGTFSANSPDLIDKISQAPRDQKRTYGFGASMNLPDFLILSNSLVALEFTDLSMNGDFPDNNDSSIYRHVHIGAETYLLPILAIRGGINQGYFALGVGIDLPLLNIDVATYGEEMSLNPGGFEDRRYALRVALEL